VDGLKPVVLEDWRGIHMVFEPVSTWYVKTWRLEPRERVIVYRLLKQLPNEMILLLFDPGALHVLLPLTGLPTDTD